MATFSDIVATASSLFSGEPAPARPSMSAKNTFNFAHSHSSSQSTTELEDLDHNGHALRSSTQQRPTNHNTVPSSPAIIRSAARRAGERRQRDSARKSWRSGDGTDDEYDHRSSYSASDRDSYQEENAFDLAACVIPASFRDGASATGSRTGPRQERQTVVRARTRATGTKARATTSSSSSSSSSSSPKMASTVTSRVMCSLRDTTLFVSLARIGNSNRVAAVDRLKWSPKLRSDVVQYLCLRTIGPLRGSTPKVALVLARDNGGKVRHLSVYHVLGRPVGVEWALGVPTWSILFPDQRLHVLQEMDEETGMPSCPAVFAVTRWSNDSNKCMLSHHGCPLIVDTSGCVTLGNRITSLHDVDDNVSVCWLHVVCLFVL